MKTTILLTLGMFCFFVGTLYAQTDSVNITLTVKGINGNSPGMWNSIIILEKNHYSKDTIADVNGKYTYYFDHNKTDIVNFIFGLGCGVYVEERTLSELIQNPMVFFKKANDNAYVWGIGCYSYDSIYTDTNLIKQYTIYENLLDRWNDNVKKNK